MVAGVLITDKPKRYAFIHALRGVAAVLVVWSHLSGFWLLATGNVSVLQRLWRNWVTTPFHLYENGGHLGVVLFFLISGFIITHTALREDRRAFTVKRLMRILPPLVFATVVSWLLLQFARATGTTLYGVNDGSVWHWLSAGVLVDGFLPEGRALDVTWTLVIEIMFYTMTFVLLGLARSHPLRSVWIMTAIWIALSVLSINISALGPANSGLALYVSFLLLGRIIYLWHRGLIGAVDTVVAGSLISLLFVLFMGWSDPSFLIAPGGWVGYEPIVTYAYALIIFMALLKLNPRRTFQPFTFLGDISYSLYLLHLPIGITVLNLLDRLDVPQEISCVVAIAAALGGSWVAYRFVEVPSQKVARRMLSQRRKRLAETPVV